MPGGQGASIQRPAEPFRVVGPLGDLWRADRLLVRPRPALAAHVYAAELRQHPARQLRSHAPLAEPDPQVDLLGPEVLGPDMLVGLLQVLPPARAVVRRRIQPGRPGLRRERAVRDPQMNLRIRHPDRGQRDSDVRRQRLPLLPGSELIRHRRDPVIRPRVRIGKQDAVIEIPDGKPGASREPLDPLVRVLTRVPSVCGVCAGGRGPRSRLAARPETSTPASAV